MNISSDIGDIGDRGEGRTAEQDAIFQEVQRKRKIINNHSEAMRAEFAGVNQETREQIEAIQEKDSKYTIKNVYGNRVLTEEGKAEIERIKQEAEERKKKIRADYDAEQITPGSVMRDGVSLSDQVQGTGVVTIDRIDERLNAADEALALTGAGTETRVPGVGTIVTSSGFFGGKVKRYFNRNGKEIKKEEFDQLVEDVKSRIEGGEEITIPSVVLRSDVVPGSEGEVAQKVAPRTLTKGEYNEEYLKSKGLIAPRDDKTMGVDAEELPIAPVQKTQPVPDPPGSTDKGDVTVIPGPNGGSSGSTASNAPGTDIAFFSSEDTDNDSILGVKSLFNVTAVAT